ncbi:hypothetical protein ACQPZ8_30005 [Actinomadura nitritigenes]|uniref:hypothetical protein n=1 Tax=Actinomadura nitritigenes TaxID=134602 RepID=UPI003D8F112A
MEDVPVPLGGVIVGGLLTLFGQTLSDRRTLRRDELRAKEEAAQRLALERVAIQRESIMEIQHALEGIMVAVMMRPGQKATDELRAATTKVTLPLQAHIARLDDRELAASVQEWLNASLGPEEARSALDVLQDRLSRRLRALYSEQ